MINVSQPTIQRAEAEDPSAKLGTYKKCAEALGTTLGAIFNDRSATEENLIAVFRRLPSDKHDRLMSILEVAKDLLPEAGSEPNQTDNL